MLEGQLISDGGRSHGGSWADYDDDGDLDIFVANYNGNNNYLYTNNGDGSFTKVTSDIVVNDCGSSVGASWGDYDNDGDLDLFVPNDFGENNFLYNNNGDGSFTKVTSGIVVNDGGRSAGSGWGDFDNDGDLDLFVANFSGTSSLYENIGNGNFTKIVSGPIVTDIGDSRGVAFCDYDIDGDLDVIVTNSQNEDNFLYANNGNSNHWINIKCVGSISNYSAIGTKVKIKSIINGNSIWQMTEISGQTGRLGQNSLNTEFGLGDATIIDSVQIEWPSGVIQILTDVSVDQFITIVENTQAILATMYQAFAPHNTETTGPFALMFRIWENEEAGVIYQSGQIHYGIDVVEQSSLLIQTTYNDSVAYLGLIPRFDEVTGTTELSYYISADFEGGTTLYWPPEAPETPATMIFGPDTTAPVASEVSEMGDVHYLLPFDKVVIARATDDRHDVEVEIRWQIWNEPLHFAPMESLDSSDYYLGILSDVIINPGDSVWYMVKATDVTMNENTTSTQKEWFYSHDWEVLADWENYRWDHWNLDGYVTTSPEFEEWGNYFVWNSTDTMSYERKLSLNLFEEVWLTIPMYYEFESGALGNSNGFFEVSTGDEEWQVVKTFSDTSGPGSIDIPLIPYIEMDSISIRFRVERGLEGVFVWYMDDIILHSDTSRLTIHKDKSIPSILTLYQNYPNPFNPNTTIRYDLPKKTNVKIVIYNLLGQKVISLVNEVQDAGQKQVLWDSNNENGEAVGSGIYIYNFTAGDIVMTGKMVLLR